MTTLPKDKWLPEFCGEKEDGVKAEDVYWDKPDLADDLRKMADNLFPGMECCLRHAMLYSAARRIEWLEARAHGEKDDG